MASPAGPLPPVGGVADGVEPAPEWVDDVEAAARFASPEAIRGGLLPVQVEGFDAAFDAALTAARRTLRLDQLRSVLQVWRRVALLTERDPDGYRAMLAAAAEVRQAGVRARAACRGTSSEPNLMADRARAGLAR